MSAFFKDQTGAEVLAHIACPDIETILVGDGDSIFEDGRALLERLVARDDFCVG